MHNLRRNHGFEAFRRATAPDEVVAAVRSGLSGWNAEEIAQLPPHCRPGVIRDAQDINQLAFTLTRERFARRGDAPGTEILVELEAFMAHACIRLAQIDAYVHGEVLRVA
jgi:hypothetical protein